MCLFKGFLQRCCWHWKVAGFPQMERAFLRKALSEQCWEAEGAVWLGSG